MQKQVSLLEFQGGLGNQLFQVAGVLCIAKQLNRSFFIADAEFSIGYTASPVYTKTVLFLLMEHVTPIISKNINIQSIERFSWTDMFLQDNDNLVITGIPMHIKYLEIIFNEIVEYFSNVPTSIDELVIDFNDRYMTFETNVAICTRTFTMENRHDWQIPVEYYKRAIDKLHTLINLNNMAIHVFSDDAKQVAPILKEILSTQNIQSIVYFHQGDRNGIVEVVHYYAMLQCNHFILTNSTYHYWPCLINTIQESNTIGMYPRECDWFHHIAHPSWICV